MIWLRTLLFAFTFVATSLVFVPRWILGAAGRARHGEAAALAGASVLAVAGVALMLWCWQEFASRGRGTPAPFDPPRRLVVAGPYRRVRNPMYVAALLFLLGQAVYYQSRALLLYVGVFWLVSHLFVVAYEEHALAARFGDDYAAYRAAVRRWLPRRTAWVPPPPDPSLNRSSTRP
jgi:protein-S-isoprenylcysteine O-methyltransferase Ste14